LAATCPIGFDVALLREHVRDTYERVAEDPHGDFHFHRGAAYAIERLGYDADEIARVPSIAVDRFAGVGNPLAIGPIHAGEVVLDHACGAGTDLLIAARRLSGRGQAIGIDMTASMCEVAARAADQAGLANLVEIRQGMFEELPTRDATVDVVISNGVLNLAPNKRHVLDEIARVLRPGGRLYMADVAVERELTLEARSNPALWAACIGGALSENELIELAAEAGLTDGRILARFDCYRGTSAAMKVSEDLLVRGVNFFARKAE
jgi:arsenite methyltransferase